MQVQNIRMQRKILQPLNHNQEKCQLQTLQEEEKQQLHAFI